FGAQLRAWVWAGRYAPVRTVSGTATVYLDRSPSQSSLTTRSPSPIFTHMDEYKSARLNDVFNALCDPTRRAILARLTDADARVTEIAADFPISLNSTSKHIRMLERA